MPYEPPRVLLVSMPISPAQGPSLGLSLLKSALARRDISCRVRYFSLDYTQRTGFDVHQYLCRGFPGDKMLGEWLFSSVLFGPNPAADREYLDLVLSHDGSRKIPLTALLDLLHLRDESADFIETCLTSVDWSHFDLVGFTLNNRQTCASLALARRIKAVTPRMKIILGGAACRDEMGAILLRLFPWIDSVCNGEGDLVFPEYVESLAAGQESPLPPGLITRSSLIRGQTISRAPLVTDLDALPYPDHDDYFDQLRSLGLDDPANQSVHTSLIELSRGCWWGEREHCTFCGSNGPVLTYRSKSPQRALDEVVNLSEHYGKLLTFADSIMPYHYLETLFPAMKNRGLSIEAHWEVKVNLTRDQIALLAQTGVTAIQVGIESFSNPILHRMNKGTDCLTNIQTLKWCRQYGIYCSWNLLFGFPGENPTEYREMEKLLPLLFHLDAPVYCLHINFERFSPYYHNPARFGIKRLTPIPAYRLIFHPLTKEDLADIAFQFHADYPDQSSTCAREIVTIAKEWQKHADATLDLYPDGDSIRIVDSRKAGNPQEYHFDGLAGTLYLHCNQACLADSLPGPASEVQAILNHFVELGLMVNTGRSYLSLAILKSV